MNDILKHSIVYGLGNVLLRLGSLMMLPVVTNCLSESDYGTIAIIDLTGAAVGALVGAGMTAAVSRQHFAVKTASARRRVWGSALAIVVFSSLSVLGLLWCVRSMLVLILPGIPPATAAFYLSIMLPHTGLELIAQLSEQYFRTAKRSQLVVALSVARLLTNMAFNVTLLVGLGWKVEGVLTGNLLTAAVFATVWTTLLIKACWPLGFDMNHARAMIRFGAPLVCGSLGGLVMHQADRYFLEVYGLAEVGRYTLAYTLVYALAMLVITSFSSIWVVKRYELADLPSAERTFARVFEQHMQTFFVAVLGLSLFAPLAIRILANPNYLSAVPVIPVLSLGYAMYAARVHFESPIHIARRTWSTVPVQVAAVVVCLLLNGLLIPPFGMLGAAWATVLTFATFAAGYYYVAQRIRPIAWPLREVALFGAVCVAGYLLVQLLGAWLGTPGYYTSATLVWLAAAAYVARDAITALRPGNAEEIAGTPVEATTAEPA